MRNKVALLCTLLIALSPLCASAQSVNSSADLQQSFLIQLQSLRQELAALTATIEALIQAAGGTLAPALDTASSGQRPLLIAPRIRATALTPSHMPFGEDPSDALLRAIVPVATTTFITTTLASTTTVVATTSAIISSNVGTPAMQMDPSCISTLYPIGGQCGGLYFCGPDTADGYWSSTACSASR